MELENVRTWLRLFEEKLVANKDYLSELDSPIGDGDHGMNMARGAEAMVQALDEKQPESVSDAFKIAGMTLVSKVGGASGPLYGSAFIAMAKADSNDLSSVIEAGLEGIKKRGQSSENEKTMIDTWSLVVDHLKSNTLKIEMIQGFAESTKEMKASKGRASYLGERSIGHIDPGAMSSAYLFEAMIEAGLLNE